MEIGNSQAATYAANYGSFPTLGTTIRVYKFGDKRRVCIGILTSNVPVSYSHYVEMSAKILDLDVSFLVDSEVLTHMRAVFDLEKNQLSSKNTTGTFH